MSQRIPKSMDALSPQNKLPKRQFDESKQGIKEQSIEDDEISFETDITGVINKTNQLNIKIFKDDSVVKKTNGKNTFSQWVDKNGGKTAVNHFLDKFDYPNLMTLNYDMYAQDSRWSKICKRGEDGMISMDYIFNSFKLAPIIVVATDSDGKIRSFATVGLKVFDDKKHLYIDVLCSCLDEQGYCPTETYVSRGPGGADIISVLLFIIVSLKMPTKYEGIILNSLSGETEKIYKSLGFNKYRKNEVPTLTTMHYNLSNRPELINELRKRVKINEGNFYFDISFLRDKKRKREISVDTSSREGEKVNSPTENTSKKVRINSNDSRNSSSGSIKRVSSNKETNSSSVGGKKTKKRKRKKTQKRKNKRKKTQKRHKKSYKK